MVLDARRARTTASLERLTSALHSEYSFGPFEDRHLFISLDFEPSHQPDWDSHEDFEYFTESKPSTKLANIIRKICGQPECTQKFPTMKEQKEDALKVLEPKENKPKETIPNDGDSSEDELSEVEIDSIDFDDIELQIGLMESLRNEDKAKGNKDDAFKEDDTDKEDEDKPEENTSNAGKSSKFKEKRYGSQPGQDYLPFVGEDSEKGDLLAGNMHSLPPVQGLPGFRRITCTYTTLSQAS